MTRSNNSRSNNSPVANIVLKTVHDAIIKANPTSTLTTKKMRAILRTKMKAVHVANASWLFTQAQADQCRCLFDPAFAARQEKVSKATQRKAAKVAKVEAPATVEA